MYASYASTAAPGGVLTVPSPGVGGSCVPRAVGFGMNVPADGINGPEACETFVSDLATACASFATVAPALSSSRVEELRLSANLRDSDPSVQVGATAFLKVDAATGATSAASRASPAWDDASRTCRDVMLGADLTVQYSLGGRSIEAATATVTYVDVTAAADGSARVPQRFSAQWRQAGEVSVREVSGNPGYVVGYPLRAGLLTESGARRAVNVFDGGLPFPGASPAGACDEDAAAAVSFGSNAVRSCALSLTAAELEALCTSPPAAPEVTRYARGLFAPAGSGLPHSGARVLVSSWGDGDPLNVTDWVEVQVGTVPSSQSWDARSQSCVDAVVGYDLQLLTGLVGSATAPQHKVVAARLAWKTGTWRWPDGQLSGAASVYLRSSVTFTPLDQGEASRVSKSTPPLMPRVPSDFLYPFLTGSAGRAGLSWAVVAAVAAASTGLLAALA